MKVARLALAVAALALAIAPASAARAGDRPYDAPEAPDKAQVPSLPLAYSVQAADGIQISFAPIAHERVRHLLQLVSGVRGELSARLGRPVLATVEIRVAAGPAEMAALSPVELPAHVRGVALARHKLVLASVAAPLSLEPVDLEEVLRHELAHLALDEAAGDHPLPRWFQEGFAVDFSGEARAARAHGLFMASMRERLLPISALDGELGGEPPVDSLASAEAADLVRFLGEPRDGPRLAKVVARVHEGDAFEPALAAIYDADLTQVERAFRKDVARRYGFVPVLLAGALLWVLVALVVLVRRLRARAANARRARRLEAREARAQALAARSRSSEKSATQELLEKMPLDPEVPKVEHDGRWYTLH